MPRLRRSDSSAPGIRRRRRGRGFSYHREDSGARVGLATQRFAEGKDLLSVASDSNEKVDYALEQFSQQRRRETGPIELTPRGATQDQEKPSSPNLPPAQSPSVPH